jgi:hypothetical protein
VDVPEISAREARLVLSINRESVIEFGGRLFRYKGSVRGHITRDFLNTAFPARSGEVPRHIRTGSETSYPAWNADFAGRPLANHVYQRLHAELGAKPREGTLYPSVSDNVLTKGPRSRNACLFERYEKYLSEIDHAAFDAGVGEARREAGKLLLVSGDLWVETPPPVISVDFSGGVQSAVGLRLAYLPDWLDPNLGRQYFPLDADGEAVEYARSVRDLAHDEAIYRRALNFKDNLRGDTGCDLLTFDYLSYSQQRTAMLIGTDLARCLDADPAKAAAAYPGSAAAALEARDLASACGTSWREWPDVDGLVEDVITGWLAAGRPRGVAAIPGKRHSVGSLIGRRAMNLAANTPIHFDVGLTHGRMKP